MQNRVLKTCPDCGKSVLMYTCQTRCSECAIIRHRENARARYYASKLPGQKKYNDREKSKKWPVKFLQKDGGYIWEIKFLNTVTDRIVTLCSVQVFPDMDKARADYVKAMR